MATKISSIESRVRDLLQEPVPRFWSSTELVDHIIAGIKDLWRDIVELKQEHFLAFGNNVILPANTSVLSNVPADVHKIYLIEPLNPIAHPNLIFRPFDYNHPDFQSARSVPAVDPAQRTLYYAITGKGGPVDAVTVYVAPKVTVPVDLNFVYVPTLPTLTSASTVPIPGEVDNALIAWTMAYAQAKTAENQLPDAGWLAVYSTEKAHIINALSERQHQEPKVVDALFEPYS